MKSMMITSTYYSAGHPVWLMTGSKWTLLHKTFNREGATTSVGRTYTENLNLRLLEPGYVMNNYYQEVDFFGISQILVNFAVLEMMNHNLILTISQLALWKQWFICHPSCCWLMIFNDILPSFGFVFFVPWWDCFLTYYSHGSFLIFFFFFQWMSQN